MTSHPDADAFVGAILRDPADVTTRLVFADWLEDTGEPSNVAWAQFIRLMAEANHYPSACEELKWREREAAACGSELKATLTICVARFVIHPELFLQLLPPGNLTVELGNFQFPPALRDQLVYAVPESIAWEELACPLAVCEHDLVFAAAEPRKSLGRLEFLQNFHNKDIILVRARSADIPLGIRRIYGNSE